MLRRLPNQNMSNPDMFADSEDCMGEESAGAVKVERGADEPANESMANDNAGGGRFGLGAAVPAADRGESWHNVQLVCRNPDICATDCGVCRDASTEREKANAQSTVKQTVQDFDGQNIVRKVFQFNSAEVLTGNLENVANFTGSSSPAIEKCQGGTESRKRGNQNISKVLFNQQTDDDDEPVWIRKSPRIAAKKDALKRGPNIFGGAKVSGLSALEPVPKLHKTFGLKDEVSDAESESLMDIEGEDSAPQFMSQVPSNEEFMDGLEDLPSQAFCTQLASSPVRPSLRSAEEVLSLGSVLSIDSIKVELEVGCNDPNKVFDIITGKHVTRSKHRTAATNGFGESIGKILFEARSNLDPALQIMIDGPVGSGKSSLLYGLTGLYRGEGFPCFLYEENMSDGQAEDKSFDLTLKASEYPSIYGMASEVSWMSSILKRESMYADAKHYGNHIHERGLDSAMWVFVKALFERNLMCDTNYFALQKLYEQATIFQSKQLLQTSVIIMLLPGEDLCRQRVLARGNVYDKHLSEELQSVQYNLYSELVDLYRQKGFEVCVIYGERLGVHAASMIGELYCYIELRRKMGRFYSEPTSNPERFNILRILKPLVARCVRTPAERATKVARLENPDDDKVPTIEDSPALVDTSDEEDTFDTIRRELCWYSRIGDKSKVLELCKETITSLSAAGIKEGQKLPIERAVSNEFPFEMSTGKKRKRSQHVPCCGDPLDTSHHMNLDYFLTVTERESSSAADIDSVLLDPSGWAQQAFKNLSLDAKTVNAKMAGKLDARKVGVTAAEEAADDTDTEDDCEVVVEDAPPEQNPVRLGGADGDKNVSGSLTLVGARGQPTNHAFKTIPLPRPGGLNKLPYAEPTNSQVADAVPGFRSASELRPDLLKPEKHVKFEQTIAETVKTAGRTDHK